MSCPTGLPELVCTLGEGSAVHIRKLSWAITPASSERGRKFFLGHKCYWKVPVSGSLVELQSGGKQRGRHRSEHEGRMKGGLSLLGCETLSYTR